MYVFVWDIVAFLHVTNFRCFIYVKFLYSFAHDFSHRNHNQRIHLQRWKIMIFGKIHSENLSWQNVTKCSRKIWAKQIEQNWRCFVENERIIFFLVKLSIFCIYFRNVKIFFFLSLITKRCFSRTNFHFENERRYVFVSHHFDEIVNWVCFIITCKCTTIQAKTRGQNLHAKTKKTNRILSKNL